MARQVKAGSIEWAKLWLNVSRDARGGLLMVRDDGRIAAYVTIDRERDVELLGLLNDKSRTGEAVPILFEVQPDAERVERLRVLRPKRSPRWESRQEV